MDFLQRSYIQDVLGIQHLFLNEGKEKSKSKYEKKTLGLPAIDEPKIIFLLLDAQDQDWSEQHEIVFKNIIKAMKLEKEKIWKSPVVETTILDFLSHLRHRQWNSQVVVMSRNPLVTEQIGRLGPHLWVEIFSVSEMIKKPEVKKISWQLLQQLMDSYEND